MKPNNRSLESCMADPIYLDHAATTPLRPEALEAMQPFMVENYANPSSIYRLAQQARSALDAARDTIAECLGARASEIIFTSGGTESNNAAIKGAAFAGKDVGDRLITSAIEHHAVLHPMQELEERFSYEVAVVPVASNGIVDLLEFEHALQPNTILASVMWANNEIGTIQPIEEIAELTSRRGVVLHVDAVQAAGLLNIDLQKVPIDLLSLSAHKFYGAKGVGVLFVRQGTPWWPLLTGGGHERNRRAGTENVAGIVGMARALELACQERENNRRHVQNLRDYLFREIPCRIPHTSRNGDIRQRLPNNVNLSFEGLHGESLLVGLDLANIMASSGSACTSGSLEPSHVLQALGIPDHLAQGSLRLTLGRENNQQEMERTVEVLETLVTRLRSLAPKSKKSSETVNVL
jgi:cysteine desulfurase